MMTALVKVEEVSKVYQGLESETVALQDISFDIFPYDFIALLGPSGCGKSTLLNLIAGFLSPTSGRITIHGQEIEGPGKDRGVVFQDTNLYPWLTVEENIQYGLKIAGVDKKERAERSAVYLNLIEMEDAGKKYPTELSGGMMKRVALARTLITQPEIILMDEPFSALDAITRSTIHALMRKLAQQRRTTFLLITHDIDEALSLANRVFVMDKEPGRILKAYDVDFYERLLGREKTSLGDDPDFRALKREIILLINDALTA